MSCRGWITRVSESRRHVDDSGKWCRDGLPTQSCVSNREQQGQLCREPCLLFAKETVALTPFMVRPARACGRQQCPWQQRAPATTAAVLPLLSTGDDEEQQTDTSSRTSSLCKKLREGSRKEGLAAVGWVFLSTIQAGTTGQLDGTPQLLIHSSNKQKARQAPASTTTAPHVPPPSYTEICLLNPLFPSAMNSATPHTALF